MCSLDYFHDRKKLLHTGQKKVDERQIRQCMVTSYNEEFTTHLKPD
jgi:hypothetical protein